MFKCVLHIQKVSKIVYNGDNNSVMYNGDNNSVMYNGDNNSVMYNGDNNSVMYNGDNNSVMCLDVLKVYVTSWMKMNIVCYAKKIYMNN